ncbi:hypothetical protein JTE90_015839 [Oedothorax gibbosus]|uniref:Hyaluronidase n=1 Tax=Oedothorax gibbosus TaxID=931172 RepID=A0AAV6VWJ3_9ARAC|nr:hypothetical protein JTE90_015839 [Oedothorax gibbosus]
MIHFYSYRITFLVFFSPVIGFEIYWNVPSLQCKNNYGIDFESLLGKYGVLVNENEKFQGGNITIFYEEQLGLYPKISESGEFINGGIPQRSIMQKHLDKAYTDLQDTIPNPKFRGLGIIDWESWRPAWDLNWYPLSIYRDKSIDYVKEKHPSIDEKLIPITAKKEWERSAKTLMLETIQLSKKLRPFGRWCYYLFPDCYNYAGKKPQDFACSENIQLQNDGIRWLFEASTAICPSVYVNKKHFNDYSFEQRTWKDNGKLKEAFRVANPEAKIYPYVNYFLETELMSQKEFERMVAQVASVGSDGAVIWGSSSSVSTLSRCKDLKTYVTNTIGPVVENVSKRQLMCTNRICNGRGKCTWPGDVDVIAWNLFRIGTKISFNPDDIVCKCDYGYDGRFCEKKY